MADIVIINPRFEISYWGMEHTLPYLGKRANLPVAWAAPAFDVLQIEEYDWVILGDEPAGLWLARELAAHFAERGESLDTVGPKRQQALRRGFRLFEPLLFDQRREQIARRVRPIGCEFRGPAITLQRRRIDRFLLLLSRRRTEQPEQHLFGILEILVEGQVGVDPHL